MKDTFGKWIYKCKCRRVGGHYAWKSELKTAKFYCVCNKELGYDNLKIKEVPQTPSIRTPTKNR